MHCEREERDWDLEVVVTIEEGKEEGLVVVQ